jgi:hypothetical protein
MGTFRKTIKYTKSSKSLDEKIQRLNEELVKTGIEHSSPKNVLSSENLFNWRNEFGEKVDLKEEVDIVIDELKEKNKYLSSVENSIKQHKLNEANVTFNEIYGDQVSSVVENYILKYAGEINHLKEDIFVELNKKPKNLKVIENRLDQLDDKYNLLSERLYKSLNASRENNLTEETQVSYKQLKDHYQRLVSKLQEQIAMAGSGGGEVRLKYLDDIVGVATNASAYDGKFLKYDHSQEKFVFETVSGGGGGGGISYSDLSAITTAPSESSSLTYDNITGIFLYTPPSLSGFTTAGDLSSYLTSSDIVGFTTAGDLVGLATAGDVSGYLSEGSDGSSLSGIVTSIIGGSGISVDQGTGSVTISAIGGGGGVSGIAYTDLSVITTSPGISTLSYDDTTGQFTYTPPAITGGIVYTDLSVITTSPGISTLSYDDLVGTFSYTPPDLSSYLTSSDIVGFTTAGDLSSYLTSSDIVGFVSTTDLNSYLLEGSDGSSLSGIVTSIIGGSGISVDQGTGSVTISAAAVGAGISYSDLSVAVFSPGISTLFYDDTTGQFAYTPPDLSSYLTSSDIVGFTTSGDIDSTFDNLTPTYLTVSGIATFSGGMQESFDTLTNATAIVNHDCSNGNVFYHTTPSSNWTVNLINFALTAEYATTITIVVNQGDPAYMPTAFEIGGILQSIKWQGNATPSGTASGIDVVSFSILNDGGTYVVMGQSVSFGGV